MSENVRGFSAGWDSAGVAGPAAGLSDWNRPTTTITTITTTAIPAIFSQIEFIASAPFTRNHRAIINRRGTPLPLRESVRNDAVRRSFYALTGTLQTALAAGSS